MTDPALWRPLLDGELAEQAWRSILEVAEALAPLATQPSAKLQDLDVSSLPLQGDLGLAGGTLGLTLFFSYLAEVRDEQRWSDVAMEFLRHSLELAPKLLTAPELFGGFAGLGWTLSHLAGRLFDVAGDGGEVEMDEGLAKLLEDWEGDYDLIGGIVGFGTCALEGLPRPSARACLEAVVRRLEAGAVETDRGLTWLTPPELLPEHQVERAPHGYYNLGMAHGVPGVVALLGACHGAGVETRRARKLLEAAVPWLLGARLDGGFPSWLAVDADPPKWPSRLAWCYGDPGVAAALWGAARHTGSEDWEAEARTIALEAARRPPEQAGIRDTSLCHGTAGLAHLFNRFYQASGEPELAEAARYWLRETLAMRRPGEGFGGYLAYQGNEVWAADAGLLTGSAGCALALLAAVADVVPAWDRSFLIDIP